MHFPILGIDIYDTMMDYCLYFEKTSYMFIYAYSWFYFQCLQKILGTFVGDYILKTKICVDDSNLVEC